MTDGAVTMYLSHEPPEIPWVAQILPRILPAWWTHLGNSADGAAYRNKGGSTVILSGATEDDGKRWLHVSTAHPTRRPTMDEIQDVKDLFIGRERYAIHVFPARSAHVNLHQNCYHLWSCMDGHPLPDFTRGGRTL
jgi:hypothetical protein